MNEIISCGSFVLVLVMELLHTVGLALLAYLVLPNLDTLSALLLSPALALVPACLLALSRFQARKIIPLFCSE